MTTREEAAPESETETGQGIAAATLVALFAGTVSSAALILSFWSDFATVVGVVSAVVTLVVAGIGLARMGAKRSLTRTEKLSVIGVGAVVIGIAVLRFVSFSSSATGRESSAQTPPPSTTAAVNRYCELSRQFTASAAAFQAGATTGTVARADLQPIIENLTEAATIAPAAVSGDMQTLLASYEQYRQRVTANRADNLVLAAGTFLSAPALASADRVDAFDRAHCPS